MINLNKYNFNCNDIEGEVNKISKAASPRMKDPDNKRKVIIFLIILSVLNISSAIYSDEVRTEKTFLLMEGEKMYIHYCASCHGDKGDGKGFNAKNLNPRPAVHTDADFMSKRTDKELHDAITGGGRAIGKSTLMPPWGNTLSEPQVQSLVVYLRKLCTCQEL